MQREQDRFNWVRCVATLLIVAIVGLARYAPADFVEAWGYNANGQLGDGNTINSGRAC